MGTHPTTQSAAIQPTQLHSMNQLNNADQRNLLTRLYDHYVMDFAQSAETMVKQVLAVLWRTYERFCSVAGTEIATQKVSSDRNV